MLTSAQKKALEKANRLSKSKKQRKISLFQKPRKQGVIQFAEVFAGIGAANASFLPLGWKNQFYIENDKFALTQYLYNWDDKFYQQVTSEKLHPVEIYALAEEWPSPENLGDIYAVNRSTYQFPPLDVLMTSPPCQSFSHAGDRAGLDEDGDLFFENHELIKRLKPRVFILENVPGMLSTMEEEEFDQRAEEAFGRSLYRWNYPRVKSARGRRPRARSTFYEIILPSMGYHANTKSFPEGMTVPVWRAQQNRVEFLEQLPYHIHFLIVSPVSFGVPMMRNRVFMVGFRKGEYGADHFRFQIPSLPVQDVFEYVNPDARLTDAFRYRILNQGTQTLKDAKNAKKKITPQGFMVSPGSEPYINTFLTGDDSRKITIQMQSGDYRTFADEQRRHLLGFPPGFNSNIVSYSSATKNYGNSISVDVLHHIGKQLDKVL